MSEWQPIESAPRDGTDFLAFEPGKGLKSSWPDMMAVGHMTDYGFRMSHVGGYEVDYDMDAPTHWRPLPSTPLK